MLIGRVTWRYANSPFNKTRFCLIWLRTSHGFLILASLVVKEVTPGIPYFCLQNTVLHWEEHKQIQSWVLFIFLLWTAVHFLYTMTCTVHETEGGQIYAILLVLILRIKISIFIRFNIRNWKHFCSSQYLFNKIENI